MNHLRSTSALRLLPQEAPPPPRRDQRKAPAARPAPAAADGLDEVEAAALEILKRRRL